MQLHIIKDNMKALSNVMWILVAIVVILIVAVVVLSVFTGGVSNFLNIFNPWSNQTTATSICEGYCSQLCIGQPEGTTPQGWEEQTANDKKCTEWGVQCVCKSGFGGLGGK